MKIGLYTRAAGSGILWIILLFFTFPGFSQDADSIQANFNVYRCDSLVQANALNPDFVIMDVRTPGEYIPDHLEGAINRNYYDADFSSQIDLLPRNKMYLIHCQGGSRSANVFTLMISMGFPSVINMVGGINAWKNAGFPTTDTFAPLLMAVSDTIVPNDSIVIGTTDTIRLTITNRANDTLRFTSLTSLAGTEFSTDFNLATTITGPFDYTFSVFYAPVDENTDAVTFRIESNGGPVQFHITRTGRVSAAGIRGWTMEDGKLNIGIFPNPVHTTSSLVFDLEDPGIVEISVFSPDGQIVSKTMQNGFAGKNRLTFDASGLAPGAYFIRVRSGKQLAGGKLVKW